MNESNMKNILGNTLNKDEEQNTKPTINKAMVQSSSASQVQKQSAKSAKPSKASSSALKVTKSVPKKPIHNNTKSTTKSKTTQKTTQLIHSNDVKSNNKSGHMLYWSTQLDLRLVAQMYAIEHVSHLKNFALVANYLFTHRKTVSDIVGNYNDEDKKHYHMYYSVYMIQNKPKAEKNYRRYHRVTAKK